LHLERHIITPRRGKEDNMALLTKRQVRDLPHHTPFFKLVFPEQEEIDKDRFTCHVIAVRKFEDDSYMADTIRGPHPIASLPGGDDDLVPFCLTREEAVREVRKALEKFCLSLRGDWK